MGTRIGLKERREPQGTEPPGRIAASEVLFGALPPSATDGFSGARSRTRGFAGNRRPTRSPDPW